MTCYEIGYFYFVENDILKSDQFNKYLFGVSYQILAKNLFALRPIYKIVVLTIFERLKTNFKKFFLD